MGPANRLTQPMGFSYASNCRRSVKAGNAQATTTATITTATTAEQAKIGRKGKCLKFKLSTTAGEKLN